MCLGKAMGVHLSDGDKYLLHFRNNTAYEYILKSTPNGFVLVPSSKSAPIGAVPFNDKEKYNFERVCS